MRWTLTAGHTRLGTADVLAARTSPNTPKTLGGNKTSSLDCSCVDLRDAVDGQAVSMVRQHGTGDSNASTFMMG